jgi:DNA polymerase-4
MHIDLDAFFVSVEQVADPRLHGKPVVVGGRPDQRCVIAAASYEARKFGLHSGMPLKTAGRLCPQAIFIEGGFAKYRAASQEFMAILADFSPFLEPVGIDEAFLDVTGFESLHGSIHQMATRIRQRIKEKLGFPASVGIASSKIVSKIASDLSKPDGLIDVSPGEEATFLRALPIGKMPGIGKRTEPRLKSLGVYTIGELAAMHLATLKGYFGLYGELLYHYSRGIDYREVVPPTEAKSISRETTFTRDSRDLKYLAAILRYLSERIGNRLRRRGRQARCISLKLRYADFTTITRNQTLKQAADTDQAISTIGLELMKKALAKDRQAIRLIGICVSGLVEPGRQLNMLNPSMARLEQLNQTIDRIRRKYGFSAIQTGHTIRLRDIFPETKAGYKLQTPSLSR